MKIIFSLLLALASAPAMAQYASLLRDSAAQRFDDEDLRLFLDNARKALNETPDNQTASWENPKTRHRGEVTVLRSFEAMGGRCKEVKVLNQAQGRKETNDFNLCQLDGKWRLVSPSQLKKAKAR
jgi:surface antigen